MDLKEKMTEEVTRTIHYVFEDGTRAAVDEVQSAQFDVLKELISGRITGDTTPQILAAVANPVVAYPDSGVVVLNPTNSAEKLSVSYNSDDIEITIMYPLEFKLNVFYVDESGNTLKDETSIQGRYNTEYNVNAPVIQGYELVQKPANVSGTFGINREGITLVYKKASATDVLPNTGNFPGMSIGILVLGLMIAAMGALKLIKERE